MRRIRVWRRLAFWALTLPVMALGSCAVIAQTSVINGLFNAVTPLLVSHVRASLGLDANSTAATSEARASTADLSSDRDLRGH